MANSPTMGKRVAAWLHQTYGPKTLQELRRETDPHSPIARDLAEFRERREWLQRRHATSPRREAKPVKEVPFDVDPVPRLLLRHDEMAAAIGVSVRHLDTLVDQGLPRLNGGVRIVLYHPESVVAWFLEHRQQTTPAPPGDAATDKPSAITPLEAAHRLGLVGVVKDPERTVRNMARRHDLRPIRIGKITLIDAESVERYARGGE